MSEEKIIYSETSEEYKAIKWLENKTTNYSDDSLILHYNNILYYLIMNLMGENKQLKSIEKEHQKINGELREEIKELEERVKTLKDTQLKQLNIIQQRDDVIEKVRKCLRDSYIEVLKYHDEPSETTSYEIVTVELLQILNKVEEN